MHWFLNPENYKKAIKNPFQAIIYLLWWKIHYSQTWEDLILDWLNKKSSGFYVDIGSNHPIRLNNTYYFYKKWWRGINIEPNKKFVKSFKYHRPKDINLQLWIWESVWTLDFYIFSDSSMSTCDIETANRYKSAGHKISETYSVPIWTLEKLFDEYIKDTKIDILSVDVEWWDMDVLKSNNRNKYKPNFIILETVEYGKNWPNTWTKESMIFDLYLEELWYKTVAETWINTIYQLQK